MPLGIILELLSQTCMSCHVSLYIQRQLSFIPPVLAPFTSATHLPNLSIKLPLPPLTLRNRKRHRPRPLPFPHRQPTLQKHLLHIPPLLRRQPLAPRPPPPGIVIHRERQRVSAPHESLKDEVDEVAEEVVGQAAGAEGEPAAVAGEEAGEEEGEWEGCEGEEEGEAGRFGDSR